jgi:hypothetical protein
LEGSRPSERTWTRKQKNHHCWSRYQETTSEDTEDWKRLSMCCSDLQSVEVSDGAVIKCSHVYQNPIESHSNVWYHTR